MRRIATFMLVVVVAVLAGCTRSEGPSIRTDEMLLTTTTSRASDTPLAEDYDGEIAALVDRVPKFRDVPFGELREFLSVVCDEIDKTDGDFFAVGEMIVEASTGYFDLDYSDAGAIVAAAVRTDCTEWFDAAQEFADS